MFAQTQPLFEKIKSTDEIDFYNTLRLNKINESLFEHHWQYIVQSTRQKGYVFKQINSRIYFYYREDENGDKTLVIVNQFGSNVFEMLEKLADLHKYSIAKLLVKNVKITSLSKWLAQGFQKIDMPWSEYSSEDDNSYPEGIFKFDVLAKLHEPLMDKKQRGCNRTTVKIIKRFLKIRNIKVRPYSPQKDYGRAFELLKANASLMANKKVDSYENIIQAHLFIFDDTLSNAIRLSFFEENELIGLLYLSKINETIYANALLNKNESNIMRFFIWKGFNYLYQNTPEDLRAKFVTFQGSENLGQHAWKKSFYPIYEVEKTHVAKVLI